MQAMEGRNKAEQELIQLREQLKQKMVSDQFYQANILSALNKKQTNPPLPTQNSHFYSDPNQMAQYTLYSTNNAPMNPKPIPSSLNKKEMNANS